jgi:hypothetical protein
MDIQSIISLLDYTLNTKRKRHIVGGILMSMAALFGGLSLTAMTIKHDKEDEEI